MKITKFEDLDIWKRSRELTKVVYRITSTSKFSKDWGLRDQLTRAAISEIQSQLYMALDQSYIAKNEFDKIYQETEEIRRMTNGFIKYLKGLS
ncbi:MAG: four helix bundle protein [Candidatus Omnitrophota bacterium]